MSVKNGAQFLAEALDSIIAQSYQDWELIAIDNFSKDEVPSILKRYSELDDRIQFHASEGDDLITALNQAFRLADGHFLTRMDGDDRMTPFRLEKMVEAIVGQKGEEGHSQKFLATGFVRYFSADGIGNGFQRYENWLNDLTARSANFSGIYKECSVASPCWMIERSSIITAHLYEEGIYPEDYNLCFRFYQEQFKVIGISEVLLEWRDHGQRASRTEANYADHTFLDLKLKAFLSIDWDESKTVTIWGAGKKGKELAKKMIAQKIPFEWICDNVGKIGKDIYGVILKSEEDLKSIENPALIIVIAGPDDQQKIQLYLDQNQKKRNIHYFWFC